ncbi:MAG: hypothetical protein KF908_12795 [Nitrosomonas sp.]|nr:hypothetical protein [Nitrosomonas sp.]
MSDQNIITAKTAPVKTFRDGAISVRIWEKAYQNSETEKTNIFYSIDMKRGYKSGDVWKSTSNINSRDALKVSNLFISANNWIIQQQYSIPAQPETLA